MKKQAASKTYLDAQNTHWNRMFANNPEMFGDQPSEPAIKAAAFFKTYGKNSILELGGGQGRDTIYFARQGFSVTTTDYSKEGVSAISEKIARLGLSDTVTALCHDVRKALPFADGSFDACYSHMLFCMALTTRELEFLSKEVRRVLKPDGFNIYTVRHTGDAQYGAGIHRGDDIYEIEGGFIVHFFSKDRTKALAKGYNIISIDEFEEGQLPKKLFMVILQKSV